jgi:hypothetical protein
MKIFVGLVAAEERLRRHFGLGKDSVVPKDALTRGFFDGRGAKVFQSAYTPEGPPSAAELERLVMSRSKDTDASLLIVDENLLHLTTDIRNSVFIVNFQNSTVGPSLQNFFHHTTAKALRALGQVLARFHRGEDGDLLILPLRNFRAVELAEIARLCRDENLESNFGDLIDTQLALLRRRLRPRKRTTYKTVYAVDDADRFFVFGRERHSRFATGGDHRLSCEIAGNMRFGKTIDPGRHFNVSETEGDSTSISGEFRDCHNVERLVKTHPHVSHLNMFANDYF